MAAHQRIRAANAKHSAKITARGVKQNEVSRMCPQCVLNRSVGSMSYYRKMEPNFVGHDVTEIVLIMNLFFSEIRKVPRWSVDVGTFYISRCWLRYVTNYILLPNDDNLYCTSWLLVFTHFHLIRTPS
eukprot:sb/3475389/